ncbi:hypothetical protein Syun_018265 [Stephania yunnanensis]|uniref:Peptidase M3A/M3B catalytic domain-containing protein n=1 Tax=Stephania yunnanensis TaxID=152371 RepID=A0AAP0ITE4_9MAGN
MQTLIRRKASILRSWLPLSREFTTSRKDYFFTSVAPEVCESGLYGFELLKSPRGFRRFVDEAIERSSELVSYISRTPPSMEIVRAMDEISDTVCSVVDSAELCRNTHPDKEFVEEANKACMRIQEYLHIINTDHNLYNAVKRAERDGNLDTDEAKRAANSLRVDFEKGGIHLSSDKLERVNQLNIDIAHMCREFGDNIMADPGTVDVFPESRIPKHMRGRLRPIYRSISGSSKGSLESGGEMKERGFQITTDPGTLSSVLQWVADDEVRRQSYIQGNSVPLANLAVLDKLIAARHELAQIQIIGHKSFAEFAVSSNLASSPEVVMSFLLELSRIVKPQADKEFYSIAEFKRRNCNERAVDLEPWDEAYYTGIMKSSAYNLDSTIVSSYFPLSQCIEGLKILVQSLFGVTFRSIPFAHGESWHHDVLKIALHHPDEGDLGYLYLDLYSRMGKYPGCAHFAIKGGRQISETEYQLPVCCGSVCNFSGPSGSSTARLNHWEVETLFHEFGHALHSLLSRTDYQHFSGTRVVHDLAETPSNLFEYYAWDYRVLSTFARHYSTGEVIPEKLVESMKGARKMFAATEMQRQVFYSLIDQTLFGEQLSTKDSVSVVADLKRRFTSWKHVDGTHWHTRFNHLLNYGAGYYSYLYAKCFAATIWQKVCEQDPLSLETGATLRSKLLRHGGAKDPSSLLKDLAGDSILRYHNGGVMPDLTCLCEEMELENSSNNRLRKWRVRLQVIWAKKLLCRQNLAFQKKKIQFSLKAREIYLVQDGDFVTASSSSKRWLNVHCFWKFEAVNCSSVFI